MVHTLGQCYLVTITGLDLPIKGWKSNSILTHILNLLYISGYFEIKIDLENKCNKYLREILNYCILTRCMQLGITKRLSPSSLFETRQNNAVLHFFFRKKNNVINTLFDYFTAAVRYSEHLNVAQRLLFKNINKMYIKKI